MIKGEENTQHELTAVSQSFGEVNAGLKKNLATCILHEQEICWVQIIMQLNISHIPKAKLLMFV